MSKIKKITATRKNRRERGVRGRRTGVNPHSKGLIFSRSVFTRLAIDLPKAVSKTLNKYENPKSNINFNK